MTSEQRYFDAQPFKHAQVIIEARKDGKPQKVKIVDAIVADVVNLNRRIYPEEVLHEAYENLIADRPLTHSGIAVGEAEHPDFFSAPNWTEAIVIWKEATFEASVRDPEKKAIHLTGEFIENARGRDAAAVMRAGVAPGVSIRGRGTSREILVDDSPVEEVTFLRLDAFDLVSTPSFENTAALTEKKQKGESNMPKEKTETGQARLFEMTDEERAKVIADHEAKKIAEQAIADKKAAEEKKRIDEEVAKQNAELRAALGLDESATPEQLAEAIAAKKAENDRLLAEQTRRDINDLVETAVDEVTAAYGDWVPTFRSALEAVVKTAGTIAEANDVIAAKRSEYDKIVADHQAAVDGLRERFREGRVEYSGEIVEQFGIRADIAGATVPLLENIRKATREHNDFNPLKATGKLHPAARFTKEYLEMFDARYGHFLREENRMFTEANSTADLQLPYTVARAIIFEAYPMLVGAQLFDYGVAPGTPVMIHYERWQDDTGIYVAVTDEDLTIAAADTPVAFANQWLVPGSETGNVTLDPIGTPIDLVYGVDYVIDYKGGTFTFLSSSPNFATGTVRVSYTYDKINNPECDVIEQGKLQIVQDQLDVTFMRLAAEICNEAISFSRANLGYDLVQRNIAHLVRVIREKIDRTNMYEALQEAVSLPANRPGGTPPTWDSSSGTVEDLIQQIGLARVLVMERNYTPEWLLMSPMTAEVLSNWTNYRDNANVSLGPNGLAGSVKGLPVYVSNLFPQNDNFVLVGTRDSVTHRVLDPMQVRGPYQKIKPIESTPGSGEWDDNRLTDSEFYYARESNGQMVPVPEKLSYVQIT